MARLESRKRQPGESIAALDDLRQMAQKAYAGPDSNAQEATALNQLYKTITLEVKCRCMDRDCQTVSEAVDVIERYERILGDQTLKKPSVRTVTVETAPKTIISEVQKMFKELCERIEKLEKNVSNKAVTDRTCFLCKRPDHLFRECPINNRRVPTQRQDHRYMSSSQRPYMAGLPIGQFQGNARSSSQ